MTPPDLQSVKPGLDRRDVLRRGAILAGSLAWTVPAVQTLSGPAFAAGSPCIGRYTYTASGVAYFVEYKPDTGCCECITTVTTSLGGPEFTVVAGALCQMVYQSCKVSTSGTL